MVITLLLYLLQYLLMEVKVEVVEMALVLIAGQEVEVGELELKEPLEAL